MQTRSLAIFMSGFLVFAVLTVGVAFGQSPRPLFPRLAPVPKTPALYGFHPPKAGPRPYYGEALGATYYNWGYFGAHQHAQLTTHSGYDLDYCQVGRTKGY